MQLLLYALDEDKYHWVKFGAARSLIEIAARTENAEISKTVIQELITRVTSNTLVRNVKEEIGNAVFYISARQGWSEEVLPLLNALLQCEQNEKDKERWQETINEFKKFSSRGYSHA